MERSIPSYEERGSEVNMADSLGIKDAAQESGKSRRSPGSVLHQKLGIQPMTEDMKDEVDEVFTCEDVVKM